MAEPGAAGRGAPARVPGAAVALAGAAVAVLAALLLFLAGRPIDTDDFWWHLALGEVYAERGLELREDPFTHTAEGPPPPHQWLFGVGLHAVERAAGLHGLRALHVLAVAGILALAFSAFRRAGGDAASACAATAVFVALAWWRLYQLRPDLVSIAATLGLVRLLLEPRTPPSWGRVAAAAGILAVWANCHTLFALGPLLLVAALLGCALHEALRGLARRRGEAPASAAPCARRLAAALGLGLLASLANPRGAGQHLAFLVSAESSALWRVRDEWTPFHPFAPEASGPALSPLALVVTDALLAGFAVAAAAGLVGFARRPSREALRRFDPVGLGLALAGIVASLVAVRFLWLAVFPLLYLLRLGGRAATAHRARAWAAAALAAAIAAGFPGASGFAAAALRIPRSPSSYLRTSHDAEKYYGLGVDFLRETGLEGRLFNAYPMGGYVARHLAPRLRSFVDGRMNFSDAVLRDYKRVSLQRGSLPGETFLDVLERHRVDVFFGVGVPTGPRDTEARVYTTANLERAAGWTLVSRSMRHAIYLRADPRNRENLARVVAHYAREGVPFDPEAGLDVAEVIRARPGWAAAHGLLPTAYQVLTRARASPDPATRAAALDALGLTRALAGAYAEQVAIEREAVALRPRAKAPRRRLVYGLLRLDRPNQALEAARELLALDPADPRSRRFARVAERYLEASRARWRDGARPRVPRDALINGLPLVGG